MPSVSFLAVAMMLGLQLLPQVLAFDPNVSSVLPRGGQQGQSVEVTLNGDRLYHPEELILYRPGMSVEALEKLSNKSVKATLRIAPDAPLGEHPLRLRTRGGVSYLRTFWVTPFPDVKEKIVRDEKRKENRDANDSFEDPQRIQLNTTVHGIARKEDADYYVFRGQKGQRITAEVFGMRLGRIMFDPYLALLDENRFELATSDDTVLTRRDPFINVVLPKDGDYTLLVRESSYEGDNRANYLLQLAEMPRPTTVFPPAAKPGSEVEFALIGDAAGEFKQSLTLPKEGEIHHFYPIHDGEQAPSPNPVHLTTLPIHTETEPNFRDQAAQSAASDLPLAFQGILAQPDDIDWFHFSARKGQKLRVQVHARSLRSPLDSVIQVRSLKGNKNLGRSDDEGTHPDSKLDFTVPEDGSYLLSIRDQLRRGGPDFVYHIEVAPVPSTLSAKLPYAENNNSQKDRAIVIPRGRHLAVVPNVTRQNTNCEIMLQADKLPTGVDYQMDPAPRNPVNFPILFSTTRDAPLAATLTRFTITDTQSDLRGPFDETINHVEINNAGAFASTHNERLTVAVIEEAPFDLELLSPAVPLVRDGTMDLVIRAKRTGGYQGPIKVKVPWRPAGVGTPSEVTIPSNQNEAILSINANSTAPTRSWKMTVTGEGKTDRGTVRLSPPFIDLSIAEPYLKGAIDLLTGPPGSTLEAICRLDHLQSFDGQAELTLQGLPHGVSAEKVLVAAGQKEVQIKIALTGEARPGKSKSLFAQILVPANGTHIPHQIARGTTLVITPRREKETAAKD
ncbi:MAG: hypothetical protein Q7Q71_06990 [Verrucomicrobiota bacterium JB023]|nr:hypothetical protein [Verrucomicrobiota bacterium JB023]